jgi:hypothetical protein
MGKFHQATKEAFAGEHPEKEGIAGFEKGSGHEIA